MKAISANPKTIREIFQSNYVIPDFQRPYSWDTYKINQLWEDCTNFHSENRNKKNTYYLGNLILYEANNEFLVIDGQQRLTTLLLLIKALFDRAGTYSALEKCFKKENTVTRELENKLRVVSKVEVHQDQENLKAIILDDDTEGTSKHHKNFRYLSDRLDEWQTPTNRNPKKLNELIVTLLDRVVLLPIRCENQDDALTMFQTINDRGQALDDSDIFKAKLYSAGKKDKKEKEFMSRWNALEDHAWLFRVHMHILRAKEKNIGNEKALRSYFQEKGKNRLQDYNEVMKNLEIYNYIFEEWDCSYEILVWWNILESYPNQYWNYPLYVFLHKHGKYSKNELSTDKKTEAKFLGLIKETVKYCFINGVAYKSANAIKDTIFRVCVAIAENKDYLPIYKKNFKKEFGECKRKLKDDDYGRYRKGLIILASFLNKKETPEKYFNILDEKYNIEHILPKEWCNYDKWDEESHKENLDKLGNLVPLEKSLNIKASNEFFQRKKDIYSKGTTRKNGKKINPSEVQDAKDLSKIQNWYPEDLERRHQKVMQRLDDFFQGQG